MSVITNVTFLTLSSKQISEYLNKIDPLDKAGGYAIQEYKELISNDEDIGLATIYRVLTQFEAAGMVTKHHFENSKAVYEINSDEHHDHMVDVDTGKVMEFHDEELEKLQHEIANKKGYELVDHSMVLHVRKIES